MIMKRTLLLLISVILVFSCKTEDSKKVGVSANDSAEIPEFSLEDKLDIPEDFAPSYEIKEKEDISIQGAARRQFRIAVPENLTRLEVKHNIYHAILNDIEQNGKAGISVLVYKETDSINRSYTVAMSEFMTVDGWENLSNASLLKDYDVNTKYIDSYFNPPIKDESFIEGKLFKDREWNRERREFIAANAVPISTSAREWGDNILVRIPNNTPATIIDTYKETLSGGHVSVRHKVKVKYNGKTYEGWIHGEEITKR